MLNLRKEASQLQRDEFRLSTCPVCNSYVCHMYFMQNADTKIQSKWFSCSCGIVFQDKKPDKIYDADYLKALNKNDEKLRDAYQYPIRIYAPVIEELLYGRRALLVGHVTDHQHKAFEERGWVTHSIDKNKALKASPGLIVDDFETFEFEDTIRYNLIWFYQTLECMIDPLAALKRCSSLLTEDGILFIASPDTDFIHTRGSTGFIHWKPDMHNLMWNRRSLSSYLEKLGFTVIMARQNYERRFPIWDDLHLIAQRKFF